MILINNLSIGHGAPLLTGLSREIEAGTLTALTGRNGSGKSTLLRVIAGLNKPMDGTVSINGVDVHHCSARTLAQTLALVTTQRVRVMNLRCRDVVAMGRAPHTSWTGQFSDDDLRVVDEALSRVGATQFAGRYLDTLSDGEAQRVMLARALAQSTPVILLDEPTSFLDPPSRLELVTLLRTLADEGRTILYSTHELDLARRLAHAEWQL